MNVQEIKESGLLELYALNTLENQERIELEELLKESEELRNELALIEGHLETYGKQFSRKPSRNLLSDIKERIKNSEEQTSEKAIPIVHIKSSTPWYSIAASILLLCSVAVNVYYYSQVRGLAEVNNRLLAEKTQMVNNTQVLLNEKEQMAAQLSDMVSPLLFRVMMEGMENYPDYQAEVAWNEKSQRTYLSVQNMPALSSSEQYQLWAIVDGVPVDLGVFNSNTELIAMKPLKDKPEAFAVTIEPKGGSASPTMDKMCVMGNMAKS